MVFLSNWNQLKPSQLLSEIFHSPADCQHYVVSLHTFSLSTRLHVQSCTTPMKCYLVCNITDIKIICGDTIWNSQLSSNYRLHSVLQKHWVSLNHVLKLIFLEIILLDDCLMIFFPPFYCVILKTNCTALWDVFSHGRHFLNNNYYYYYY